MAHLSAMLTLAAAAISLLSMQAAPALPTVDKVVRVDGRDYRVRARNGRVSVDPKGWFIRHTMDERARQRRAVALATGCRSTDEFGNKPRLRATLACP
jgi:uncharacterized protein (DUF2141 family)